MVPTAVFSKLTLVLTGSPVQITPTGILANDFEVHNVAGNASMYIGDSTVDSTWIPFSGGSTKSFSILDVPGQPRHFDLSKVYVNGTLGDSVIVQYIKRG